MKTRDDVSPSEMVEYRFDDPSPMRLARLRLMPSTAFKQNKFKNSCSQDIEKSEFLYVHSREC